MTDSQDQDVLLRLAENVADGEPVDWNRERTVSPGIRGELDSLELLARIHPSILEVTSPLPETYPAVPRRSSTSPTLFHWGHLQIIELLGHGSFGEVYRAFDPALEIEVALKLRNRGAQDDEDSVRTFLAEARRLARVRHSNVLIVHGADVRNGRVGIWTELVCGTTLEEHLLERGPLGVHEATGITIDLCRALAAVHGAGLIHRDVKTGNIMLDRNGRIVLMDFGSGSELVRLDATMSEGDMIYGTPLFMAPEQLERPPAPPAASMDIYGLGVVLYRLVSGEFPIRASTLPELVQRHARGPIPLRDLRPDLPFDFVQVVHRALARGPEQRFASAGEMELALGRVMSASATPAVDPSPIQPRPSDSLHPNVKTIGPRAWWRRRSLWASGAAAAAVAVAFGLQSAKKAQPPSPPLDLIMPPALVGHASLWRSTPAGDEELLRGSRIRPGDKLSMLFEGSDSMHLYVLDEDERGEVFVLFPLKGVVPSNPLSPGKRHRLPGVLEGRNHDWKVTSPGGRESIVAIAVREPWRALDLELERLVTTKPGVPVRLPEKTKRGLREAGLSHQSLTEIPRLTGISGLEPHEPRPPRLADILERVLRTNKEAAGNYWFWKIDLENPGPAIGHTKPKSGDTPPEEPLEQLAH